MHGKKFFRTIRLENILSYGPNSSELLLEPLNVFIGPNASGKSNLIEALSVLAAAPKDIQSPFGGISDWLWKGAEKKPTSLIEVTTESSVSRILRYRLRFGELNGRFCLVDEGVESEHPTYGETRPFIFYAYQNGHPILSVKAMGSEGRLERNLERQTVTLDQSILSQRRDPDSLPEISELRDRFDQIRFYREWNLGRRTPPRLPQQTDLPNDFLREDASNLGLVLNDLKNRPPTRKLIIGHLQSFYEAVSDFETLVQGGTIQIYFHEEGLKHPVPATRLSDGTLRFLCLLTILCHPEPPPVVCIEEPEVGLHPDVIPIVAKLLIEAANRTQLFVTTHSDALVDALSEVPESIVVCERGSNGTELRRLDAGQMAEWLDRYRLGELWQMGEIGGNPR